MSISSRFVAFFCVPKWPFTTWVSPKFGGQINQQFLLLEKKNDFRVPKVFDALIISGIIPHSSWAICTSFGDLPDLNSICHLFHECKLALRPPRFQGVAAPHPCESTPTDSVDFRHQNGEPPVPGDPGWRKVKIHYSSQHISQYLNCKIFGIASTIDSYRFYRYTLKICSLLGLKC